MKTIKRIIKGLLILVFLSSNSANSQNQDQLYVNVTTMYWNMDLENFSTNEWKSVEMEYHEKVTMKNEHILSTTVLQHHFTNNSAEVLFITVYPTWTAMEEATKRNIELEAEAWPDEKMRKAFLLNQSKFYNNKHSDEIYRTIPGAIALEETDLPLLYYVRTSYFSYPEDSDGAISDEFMSMLNEYNEVVTHKNEHYMGYYPQVHFYGADRTEFVEVFIAETLAELEKGIAMQGKLHRDHWKGEERMKIYDKVMDKYLTGIHSDRIFSSVPELHKSMNPTNDEE